MSWISEQFQGNKNLIVSIQKVIFFFYFVFHSLTNIIQGWVEEKGLVLLFMLLEKKRETLSTSAHIRFQNVFSRTRIPFIKLKKVRLWINDLLFHLMDLNWICSPTQLGCEFTADSYCNEAMELFIHHLAHSPFTQPLLCTYYAPGTVQRL